MKKLLLFCALCCLTITFPLFGQEEEYPDDPAETPEGMPEGQGGTDPNYVVLANQGGDQFILISLMLPVPIQPTPDKLLVGGAGILGYMRFLNSRISVGGTLNFGYHTTLGGNVFYYVPISAKITYQPTVRRVEFPLSLSIGGAFENYMDRTYFGLFLKPEIGVYFRFSPAWSFGGGAGVMFMPQWYENTDKNYIGIIADVGLSARYHF